MVSSCNDDANGIYHKPELKSSFVRPLGPNTPTSVDQTFDQRKVCRVFPRHALVWRGKVFAHWVSVATPLVWPRQPHPHTSPWVSPHAKKVGDPVS